MPQGGSGHDPGLSLDQHWGTPPTGSPPRLPRPTGSKTRKRTHIPRTCAGRPLSPGRVGHGSRRAMERRSCGLPPAPCASQKQSSPPGPATSCVPSIHREVVRITDPGSSSSFSSQSHDARPGNPHRPRWRSHPLEHPPPALSPHPPAPGIPPPSTTLRGHPWHWTYAKIQVAPHLVSGSCACDSGPPPSDLHAAKRSVRAKKEKKGFISRCWQKKSLSQKKIHRNFKRDLAKRPRREMYGDLASRSHIQSIS